jgi:hypothetical protein
MFKVMIAIEIIPKNRTQFFLGAGSTCGTLLFCRPNFNAEKEQWPS